MLHEIFNCCYLLPHALCYALGSDIRTLITLEGYRLLTNLWDGNNGTADSSLRGVSCLRRLVLSYDTFPVLLPLLC